MFGAIALSLTIAAVTPSNQAATATKLAEAIANSRGYTSAKVYVGVLPPGTTSPAPLPKFALLGSVVTTSPAEWAQAGSSAELYYQLPAGADSALASYTQQLQAAGWKMSTFTRRVERFENPGGGFAVSRPKPELPDMYCNGDKYLAVVRLRSMHDIVAVAFGGGRAGASLCAMGAMLSAMPSPAPAPPLPTLQAPPNVTMEAGGRFSAQFSSTESNATITTAEPLPSVGTAFAQQLTAAGWTADAAAQSPTAYAQTFHMTSKGRRLFAILNLTSRGKDQKYDAALSVSGLDARPSASGFSFPFFP